ncbi:N-acetylmuramoyl-L-alanine amidase [Oceaniglobus trochenteri]|uniref:N-acetylmuramoyl-L-alanine amidase n=1 Tax=Oceaniglobus trochenteri TaxID=2763260 RepID=UPI001CFFDAA2|nr:N-acetylmuramoyl-L-alanine amidase [Oceaniglobus trochenteri]
MSNVRIFAVVLVGLLALSHPVAATDGGGSGDSLSALARPDLERSEIIDIGDNLQMTLALSQPVPWRIFTLDDPARLVVDFNAVDWSGQDMQAILFSDYVSEVLTGPFLNDWTRLVLRLSRPMALETAALVTGAEDGGATLKVQMRTVDHETFAASAIAPPGAVIAGAPVTDLPPPRARQRGGRPLVVVLDPGHGGIDPGADAEGVIEAHVMLRFAKDLRGVLEETGRFRVVLTRESDVFVPLEERVTVARMARADVFLSLHADALAEGRASGATVYTLSQEASDEASRVLAERHDRADLLAGLDLSDQDDVIAGVLMDMARRNTTPRADRLAGKLVAGLAERTGDLHKRPRLRAGFSVLKAPDIPSALIELGFLSSAHDRARLTDPQWRHLAAMGIRDGLLQWAREDAAEAELLRQ